jgi:hypothetical protein
MGLIRDCPRAVWVSQCIYGAKRPFPSRDEPLVSKHPRIQEGMIHVGVAAHAQDGVMFGTFVAGTLHQPHILVGIVARHHWSPWECISSSRGLTVVWMAEDSPRELTPSRILFASLSLAYLIQSQVSLILSNDRLPGPSSFWWASTSPLFLVVGIRLPKRKPDSTASWHHQRIPWTHAYCGGVSASTVTCHVATHVTMGPQSISLSALPRRSLSSVLSKTIGDELSRPQARPNGHLRLYL